MHQLIFDDCEDDMSEVYFADKKTLKTSKMLNKMLNEYVNKSISFN